MLDLQNNYGALAYWPMSENTAYNSSAGEMTELIGGSDGTWDQLSAPTASGNSQQASFKSWEPFSALVSSGAGDNLYGGNVDGSALTTASILIWHADYAHPSSGDWALFSTAQDAAPSVTSTSSAIRINSSGFDVITGGDPAVWEASAYTKSCGKENLWALTESRTGGTSTIKWYICEAGGSADLADTYTGTNTTLLADKLHFGPHHNSWTNAGECSGTRDWWCAMSYHNIELSAAQIDAINSKYVG
jgi:hypothetical protein